MTRLKTKHTEWLLADMAITVSSFLSSNPKASTSRPVGRSPIEYVKAGPRQNRKLASDLADNQGHNTSLLVHAAAEKTKEKHTALVLKNTFLTPIDLNMARNNFFTQKNDLDRLTEDEALVYLLENSLTKSHFNNIRELSISRSCEPFSAYNKVREAKSKCRPFDINVTESVAEVPLQNLLDHTSCRIIQMQEDIFKQPGNTLSLTLITSYGYDGTRPDKAISNTFLDVIHCFPTTRFLRQQKSS